MPHTPHTKPEIHGMICKSEKIARFIVWAFAWLLFASTLQGGEPAQPKKSPKETLPERALTRLGSLDFAHDSLLQSMELNRDGSKLLTSTLRAFHVWDTASKKEIARVTFKELDPKSKSLGIFLGGPAVRFCNDGNAVVACTSSGYFIWDLKQRMVSKKMEFSLLGSIISSNGKWLCAIARDKNFGKSQLVVYDLTKHKPFGKSLDRSLTDKVYDVSDDGKQLLYSTSKIGEGFPKQGQKNCLWDVETGKETILSEDSLIRSMRFAVNGLIVMDGFGPERSIEIRNIKSAKSAQIPDSASYALGNRIAVSPDGCVLTYLGLKEITVWDLQKNRRIQQIPRSFNVMELSISGDNAVLASGCNGVADLWDIKSGKLLTPRPNPRASVSAVAMAPDAKSVVALYSGIGKAEVLRWQANGKLIGDSVNTFATIFSRGKTRFTTGITSVEIRRFNDFEIERTIERNSLGGERIKTATLSADGKTLAVATSYTSDEGVRLKTLMHIYDTETGNAMQEFNPELQSIDLLRFSLDGSLLIAKGNGDKKAGSRITEFAKLYCRNLADKSRQFDIEVKWPAYTSRPFALEFTKDSKGFLTQDDKANIILNDAKTGKATRTIRDKKGSPTAFAVAPRSGVVAIAVGRTDSAIEIWDFTRDKKIHALAGGHRGDIKCLAFSDDEAFLISGGDDTTALIWDFKGIVK
jgi:WD40 repeat protein